MHSFSKMTEAEYLEIERDAKYRSEFLGGQMITMPVVNCWHSLIRGNLICAIGNQLNGSSCLLLGSDMRVKVQAAGFYTYTDLLVVCGEHQAEDEHDDTLLNPTVIVEIFSESSEAYDRGRKFQMYRQLPSLREYVLVCQYEPRIDWFRRVSGGWLLRDASSSNSKISLSSLGIKFEMADVYANILFEPVPPRTEKPDGRCYF
jgi:Uma2 family endonuclease